MATLIGEVLDGARIVERVNTRGGRCNVYRAEDGDGRDRIFKVYMKWEGAEELARVAGIVGIGVGVGVGGAGAAEGSGLVGNLGSTTVAIALTDVSAASTGSPICMR